MAKGKDAVDGNVYWSGRKSYCILQDDRLINWRRFVLINFNMCSISCSVNTKILQNLHFTKIFVH